MQKKRYAIVGLGSRSEMYQSAILSSYRDTAELVALLDNNAGRARLALSQAKSKGANPAIYPPEEFSQMITEQRPDVVIVTSNDSTHDHYLCAAMDAGCDVITEKPMTIDAARCERILETQRRTGRSLRVTFNYRYSPPRTLLKELLLAGTIGEIRSVDFQWMLDTHHGADYFRRWHRKKENSGGLLVHKATHHFDLVNWWLGAIPTRVIASGQRRYATPEMAAALGLRKPGARCRECPETRRCIYYLDLAKADGMRRLYLEQEKFDGYFRDQCVFSPDTDIEDAMQVLVDYDNGAALTYSLNAFCAWEGYIVNFNGTKGRLEHKCMESVYMSGDGTVQGALKPEGTAMRVYPIRGQAYEVPIPESKGGHGGGDYHLLKDIFAPGAADPLKRAADQRGGAYSILVGIAANASIANQSQPIKIDTLVGTVGRPDYP